LIHEFCPKIVFNSETRQQRDRQQRDRVNNLMFRLCFSNCFVVDGVGKGGGLALYWDESIKLDIVSYGLHHIDTAVWSMEMNMEWRASFVNGEPRVQDRHLMWNLLKRIKPMQSAPWVMIGDFNEALWGFEHFSLHKRAEHQMEDFQDVLSQCNLHDIGFQGCLGLMITSNVVTGM
jgi:hypothetical protein